MSPAADLMIGDEVDVVVGPLAHGGHCVARHEGRVIFVRHTIPGERVTARITEGGAGDRLLRADAVAVIEASPHRVPSRCPVSGPGGCGGCDFQHVALQHQRTLKAAVVAEQLSRLAGREVAVEVEPLDDADGLGYRTRVELAVGRTDEGRSAVGLRRHRSHTVIPLRSCPIADPRVDEGIAAATDPAGRPDPTEVTAVDVVAASAEENVAVVEVGRKGETARVTLREVVDTAAGERVLTVDARGFWQVHRDAPRTFVAAVLGAAQVQPGERVLDLYSGVGLLSLPLAEATGPSGQLVAVEADPIATGHLEATLAGLAQALVVRGRVDDLLGVPRPARGRGRRPARRSARGPARGPAVGASRSPLLPPSADVVVLDPPRTGAGRGVVTALATMRPRRLVYVACDPAALARDCGYLGDAGYELTGLRAFDAFPMTQHVECVATFEAR